MADQLPWIPPGSGPKSLPPKIEYTPEYGGRFYDLGAFAPEPEPSPAQQQFTSWTDWRQNEGNGQQTYWEDPVRVARWNNVIQSQPKDWQPPEYINKQAINTLYNYYQSQQGGDWQTWKPLANNDAMTALVRTMVQPPAEFMTDYENQVFTALEEQAAQAQIKTPEQAADDYYRSMGYEKQDWEGLPTWQKWTLSIANPQTEVEGRPESSRALASVVTSGIGAIGAFGLGTMAGGPVLGAVLASVVMGEGIYRSYTGKYIPGISDLMMVFNLPAEAVERGAGVISQMQAEGVDQIMNDLPAAWAAAKMKYEVDPLIDVMSIIGNVLGGVQTNQNQVWRFSEGYTEPMPILNQTRTGIGTRSAAALEEARERISGGEDAAIVYADFMDRFGDTGTFNDFIAQSVLDPLNLMPYVGGRLGEKIARVAGKERLAQAIKATTGNPLIDILPPGVQTLAELITGASGSKGLWTAFRTYGDWVKTGYWPDAAMPRTIDGVKYIPKVDELTWFDRKLGGLTKEGLIKELQPMPEGRGVKQFIAGLKNLTPDSQASLFLSNTSDNLATLLLLSDNPNLGNMERAQMAAKLIRQAAGADVTAVGDAGEAILNSPMTASTAAALRDYVRSGVMDNFLAEWSADQGRIGMLENMASILGVEAARLIDDIRSDPQGVLASLVQASRNSTDPGAAAILADYDAGNLTPQSFTDQFAIFTGDNPTGMHAWDFNDWRARVVNSVLDTSMDYVTKNFGVKQNKTLNRFAELLKASQSALLLDLNPGYLVNNVLNNWITRAAEGVFGFMTKRQIDGWMERFGATPARMDTGYGGAELVETTSAARSETQGGYRRRTQELRDITLGDGALARMIKMVNKARNKFGVASKLSAGMEQRESAQAYTIGMQKMWDKLWRPGTGYERMPGQLEAALAQVNPDLPGMVYAAVNGGMNMAEVEGTLFDQARRVNVSSAIDEAARTIFPDNQDAAREILRTTGIGDELARRLENAQTPRDVERAMTAVRNRMQDFLDRVAAQELVNVEPEIVQRVQTEGFSAVLPTYTDLQIKIAERWLEHFRNIEEMVNRVADGTPEERNAAWRQIGESESRDWRRTQEFETQVMSGIFQTLNMDLPETHQFILRTKDINQAWRDFYDGYDADPATGQRITWAEAQRQGIVPVHMKGRNDLFRELFARSENMDSATFRREYARVEQIVSDMARVTQERETILQQEADTLFAMSWNQHTGTDPAPVMIWRQTVWDVRKQMMEGMNAFRDQLRGSRMTSDQRRAAWQQFLARVYNPLIVKLTMEEISGARQTFGEGGGVQPTPGQPTPGGQPTPTGTPTPGGAPPDLGSQVDAARVRQETIDNATQQRTTAQTRAEGLLNRETAINRMAEAFNLNDEVKTALGAVLDLYAQRWAERNNSTPEEWYASRIRDIRREQYDPGIERNVLSQLAEVTEGNKIFVKNPEIGQGLIQKSVDYFGITSDLREAGFILPDGRLLDFSGKKDAGFTHVGDRYVAPQGQSDYLKGRRETDHSDVRQIIDIDFPGSQFSSSVQYFAVQTGTIRIDWGARLVDIYGELTPKQIDVLLQFDDATIEINDPLSGKTIASYELNGTKRLRQILNQINAFFKEGQVLPESGVLYQSSSDLITLANRYGISTATNKGTPNDAYLLNIIKKYGGDEGKQITRLDEVSTELAERAFEARRVEKGLPSADMNLPEAKGEIQFVDDGKAIIRAFQGADVSTLVHEIGHIFRRDFYEFDEAGRLKPTKELDAVAKLVGLTNGNEYLALQQAWDGGYIKDADRARYVDAEEQFARAWERYLADDKGFVKTLDASIKVVFEKFTGWVLDIYKKLTGSEIDINLDRKITLADGTSYSLRKIFDELLFDREAVQKYERNRPGQVEMEQLVRRSVREGIPLEQLAEGLDIRADELAWMKEAQPQFERQIQATRSFGEDLAKRQADTTQPEPERTGPLYEWIERPVSETELPDNIVQEIRKAADFAAKNFPGSEFGSQKIRDGEGNIVTRTKSGRVKLMERLNQAYRSAGGTGERWNTKQWIAAFKRIAEGKDTGSIIDKAARDVVQDLMLGEAMKYEPIFQWISEPYLNALGDEMPASMMSPEAWFDKYSDQWFERELALEDAVDAFIRTQGEGLQPNDLWREAHELFGELPQDFQTDLGTPVRRLIDLVLIWERGYTIEPIESTYHGNTMIDRVVKKNGEPVAYMPGMFDPMREDGALMLGLDPADANVAIVVERGGLKRVPLGQAEPLRQQGNGTQQAPAALRESQVAEEARRMMVDSLLNGTHDQLINQLNRQGGSTIPEDTLPEVRRWLKKVDSSMASTKLATMRHGEQMRDMALLNYNKRTGMDTMLNMVFPYQFWYTRTMMNWAMRMIDRPAWFSMYARTRELQKKYEKKGIPTRLKGKMKLLAPYLPSWAGGSTYFDPFKVIFPFEQFGQPFENMRMEKSRQAQTTYEVLRAQLDNGQITQAEYDEAAQAKDGYIWNKAWAQAGSEIDGESGSPMGLVGMMMQPGMYLTAPMNILQGTPEKISPLPGTRAASAVESVTKGTMLEPLGTVIGSLARPERWIREKFNLSEFGEWGDYYIDRQIANMTAEGLIDAEEAQKAMIERQGTVFEQATERVRYEVGLRTPGILPIAAAASGGKPLDILAAVGAGLFPQSLLPAGEMTLRGLSDEYSKAWDNYNAGNKNAINTFFEDNPEYKARLALYDEPQERLRQFLISEIWDSYGELERPNKSKAVDQLGEVFVQTFLDKETRSYDAVDVETLAYWAQLLGGMVPRTTETKPVTDMPLYKQTPLELYPPELAQGVEAYQNQRDELFPNWYEQQSAYYNGGQKSPQLEQYWKWKREYEKTHLELEEYFNQNRQSSTTGEDTPTSTGTETPEIVNQFYQAKEGMFPGIDQHSQMYETYGVKSPELQRYWDWKDEAEKSSPELAKYMMEQRIANSPYPENVARGIEEYKQTRDVTFLNWRTEQDGYYAAGKSKVYLSQHPDLKKYWDWKNTYRKAHPEIEVYFNQSNDVSFAGERDYQEQYQMVNAQTIMGWDQALQRQLLGYFYSGEKLTSGARKALMVEWEKLGKPGGKFEVFLDEILRQQVYGN